MRKYLKDIESDWYKQRIVGIVYIVMIAFTALSVRLFYLQVVEGENFRSSSNNQKIRKQNIEASRGIIFDRNGIPLVDNRPSFNLSIVIKDANPLAQTINKLSNYIGIPSVDLSNRISRNRDFQYNPVVLKHDLDWPMLATVESHKFDLPGIIVDITSRRNYINGISGAHFLGYLGEINSTELSSGMYQDCRQGDYIGKIGIEKELDKYLRGNQGGKLVEVNALGQIVRNLNVVDPQPGNNVYLSIDQKIQARGEELMKDLTGAVVMMDAENGEILAFVSSPAFDPNSFVGGISRREWKEYIQNPERPMENKVIRAQYAPASTYKIVTAIAGLEEGVIDESSTFFCPGFLRFGDRDFRCWKKGGHGTANVIKGIAESCDVFFYQVGIRLGVDRIAHYANLCGLGLPTGIKLGKEEVGLIPTSKWKQTRFGDMWHKGETLSIAIGQGYNLVTPLQMACLMSAIANGGKLIEPILVKKIVTASGNKIEIPELEKRKRIHELPFKKKTMELLNQGLWRVVNGEGTGYNARIQGYDIYGKTGTGQIVGRKSNENGSEEIENEAFKPHAWFVSWAALEGRKIAIATIVEHGEHGSQAAAPIARELYKCFLSK